jgi:hypothetical protein
MRKNLISQSGIFNPRVLLALALCSCGVLLGVFSLAAKASVETTRGNTSKTPLAPAAQGDWAIVNSPNTSAAESNRLWAVTCLSASECWAVGDHYPGNAVTSAQTLIQRWDGNSWAIVNSPNTGTYNTLYGVTCISSSDCWAVGFYNTSQWQTLTQHWDGTSWTVVSSPNAGALQTNILLGVTCASTSDCWAVGYATNGSGYDSLIEHWNGTAWAIVSAPTTGIGQSNRLLSVTCASASDCWAVGYSYVTSDATARTLIERWNGTSWTIVNSPNALTVQNFLVGVTCALASDCWAVGYTNDAGVTSAHQTLIERWDGTAWAIVSSPNTSTTQHNWLTGVTCASASECWAVGYIVSSTYQTLIERWNGTAWELVASPNSSSMQLNLLYGVACVSASDCWAVGVWSTGSAWQTLTEHYTVPPVELVTVTSTKVHGDAGTFDVDLASDGSGIECRSGGSSNDYTLVFTFTNPLTTVDLALVSSGTGSVSSSAIGSDAHQYIVNLTGVTNAQLITVSLTNVSDSAGNSSSLVSASMSILIADVNGNGAVSNTDVAAVKAQVAAPVTSSNFRHDVNANGIITNTDVSVTKAQVGSLLP